MPQKLGLASCLRLGIEAHLREYAVEAGDGTHPNVRALSIARGGQLWLHMSYDADDGTSPDISCSGSCDVFGSFWNDGSTAITGAGTIVRFTGTVAGKRYALTGGSHCGGNLGASYFPGDVAGTVDSSTYCWYE